MERCRQFLAVKAPEAAKRAGQAVEQQFRLLEAAPDNGQPLHEIPHLRELVIAFGDSGYVALSCWTTLRVAHMPTATTTERLNRRFEMLTTAPAQCDLPIASTAPADGHQHHPGEGVSLVRRDRDQS